MQHCSATRKLAQAISTTTAHLVVRGAQHEVVRVVHVDQLLRLGLRARGVCGLQSLGQLQLLLELVGAVARECADTRRRTVCREVGSGQGA